MKIFKNLLEKIIKAHTCYLTLKLEKEKIINNFQLLTQEYVSLEERLNYSYDTNAKQYKFVVKYANKIIKLVKTLEQNETTKEIRKLCNEVKKGV